MRRRAVTVVLCLTLLVTALAGAMLGLAQANPSPSIYRRFQGIVQPKPDTVPPEILISSPLNGSIISRYGYAKSGYVGSVELVLDVAPPTGPTVITEPTRHPDLIEVYYTTSWNQNKTFIIYSNRQFITKWVSGNPTTLFTNTTSRFSGNVTVKDVPHGWQNITVYAEYVCWYDPYDEPSTAARFYINGSSTVRFFMDTALPAISVLSPLNQTYTAQDVPLNFYVNKSTSKLAYSVDGAEKVAVQGNVTLAGLSLGAHNVTVYAWDTLGRMGISETIIFSVSEPQFSPLMGLAAASASSIAVVGVGLLVYFKKKEKVT